MRIFKSQKGFTLLEVLITMAVLGIGILGSAGMAAHVIRGSEKSIDLTAATIMGQAVLEQYRTDGYFTVEALASPIVNVAAPYTTTTTITPATPNANMVTVGVVVTWNKDVNDVNHAVSFDTILSRPGGQ